MKGPIIPGTPIADELGFSASLFEGYLYMDSEAVIVSAVISLSPRQGHFEHFINSLLKNGNEVRIPTPSPYMRQFLTKHKFQQTFIDDENMGEVELWIKKPEMSQSKAVMNLTTTQNVQTAD